MGRRIGQIKSKAADSAKQFTFEEQERRLKARADGDLRLEQSRNFLGEASQSASFDEIPYVPGCWTLELHGTVLHLLDLASENHKEAEVLYTSAGAKDKVPHLYYCYKCTSAAGFKHQKIIVFPIPARFCWIVHCCSCTLN